MQTLNDAIYAAVRAARDEDGAPADALREIAADLLTGYFDRLY